jgi:hypothetical protein
MTTLHQVAVSDPLERVQLVPQVPQVQQVLLELVLQQLELVALLVDP